MSLGLEVAAHHAERENGLARPNTGGLALLGHKAGDNGVEWPLVRLQFVQVTRIQREDLTPVLQSKAQAVRRHLRAEAVVGALDERDHIAVFVGGCEVNRIRCAR